MRPSANSFYFSGNSQYSSEIVKFLTKTEEKVSASHSVNIFGKNVKCIDPVKTSNNWKKINIFTVIKMFINPLIKSTKKYYTNLYLIDQMNYYTLADLVSFY